MTDSMKPTPILKSKDKMRHIIRYKHLDRFIITCTRNHIFSIETFTSNFEINTNVPSWVDDRTGYRIYKGYQTYSLAFLYLFVFYCFGHLDLSTVFTNQSTIYSFSLLKTFLGNAPLVCQCFDIRNQLVLTQRIQYDTFSSLRHC